MTTHGRIQNLKSDQRGAVLIIGLFMALSLVGSLWFLVGIGDAIVFRDRGQELADAAAMSSATMHARGMNFVAATNIIMLCMTAIYLLICMVGDFLIFLAGLMAASIVLSESAPPVADAGAEVLMNAWDYSEAITPIMEGIALVQAVVAIGAPWVGSATGMDVADTAYNERGQGWIAFSLGASNLPGFAVTGGFSSSGGFAGMPGGAMDSVENIGRGGAYTYKLPKNAGAGNLRGIDPSLGLPVAFEKNQSLCVRAVGFILEALKNLVKKIPVIGWVFDIPFIGGVIDSAIGAVSTGVALLHCNDAIEPWPLNGPKKMTDKNGGATMQIYGLAMNGTLDDDNDRHVMMAEGPQMGLFGGPVTEKGGYQAQSEFFFDCEDDWSDDGCNGGTIGINTPWGGIGLYDWQYAIYSLRWQARLVRYRSPLDTIFGAVINKFVNAITGSNAQNFLKYLPGAKNILKSIDKFAGKYGVINPTTGGVTKGGGIKIGQPGRLDPKTYGQGLYDAIYKGVFNIGKKQLGSRIGSKPGLGDGKFH